MRVRYGISIVLLQTSLYCDSRDTFSLKIPLTEEEIRQSSCVTARGIPPKCCPIFCSKFFCPIFCPTSSRGGGVTPGGAPKFKGVSRGCPQAQRGTPKFRGIPRGIPQSSRGYPGGAPQVQGGYPWGCPLPQV